MSHLPSVYLWHRNMAEFFIVRFSHDYCYKILHNLKPMLHTVAWQTCLKSFLSWCGPANSTQWMNWALDSVPSVWRLLLDTRMAFTYLLTGVARTWWGRGQVIWRGRWKVVPIQSLPATRCNAIKSVHTKFSRHRQLLVCVRFVACYWTDGRTVVRLTSHNEIANQWLRKLNGSMENARDCAARRTHARCHDFTEWPAAVALVRRRPWYGTVGHPYPSVSATAKHDEQFTGHRFALCTADGRHSRRTSCCNCRLGTSNGYSHPRFQACLFHQHEAPTVAFGERCFTHARPATD